MEVTPHGPPNAGWGPTSELLAYYTSQSPVTDPGAWKERLDSAGSDIVSIRDAARELIRHMWPGPGPDGSPYTPEQMREIDLRFAEAIFGRAFELADVSLSAPRLPDQKVVACCRDFSVIFVSIARHRGIPARVRSGFATYLIGGCKMDHVIGEVWDAGERRWRRVDAQLADGHLDPDTGKELASLDVAGNKLISSAEAWLASRGGDADPDSFVVAPHLVVPGTFGYPLIVHNLQRQLAALTKREMVCWDAWGLFDEVMAPGGTAKLSPERERELDELAELMLDPDTPVEAYDAFYERPGYCIPRTVTSFSHATAPLPLQVELGAWVEPMSD